MLRVRNALPLATLNAFKVGWQLCLLFRTFPAVDELNHPKKQSSIDSTHCLYDRQQGLPR
jgi:hypothetical protein